jgi:hypothetical protein
MTSRNSSTLSGLLVNSRWTGSLDGQRWQWPHKRWWFRRLYRWKRIRNVTHTHIRVLGSPLVVHRHLWWMAPLDPVPLLTGFSPPAPPLSPPSPSPSHLPPPCSFLVVAAAEAWWWWWSSSTVGNDRAAGAGIDDGSAVVVAAAAGGGGGGSRQRWGGGVRRLGGSGGGVRLEVVVWLWWYCRALTSTTAAGRWAFVLDFFPFHNSLPKAK